MPVRYGIGPAIGLVGPVAWDKSDSTVAGSLKRASRPSAGSLKRHSASNVSRTLTEGDHVVADMNVTPSRPNLTPIIWDSEFWVFIPNGPFGR